MNCLLFSIPWLFLDILQSGLYWFKLIGPRRPMILCCVIQSPFVTSTLSTSWLILMTLYFIKYFPPFAYVVAPNLNILPDMWSPQSLRLSHTLHDQVQVYMPSESTPTSTPSNRHVNSHRWALLTCTVPYTHVHPHINRYSHKHMHTVAHTNTYRHYQKTIL